MSKIKDNYKYIWLFGVPICLFFISYLGVIIGLEQIFSLDLHSFSIELLLYLFLEPISLFIGLLWAYWHYKHAGNLEKTIATIIDIVNNDYKTVVFVQIFVLMMGFWNPFFLFFALLVIPITVSGGAFYVLSRHFNIY